jgi:hypothetical protein
VTIATNEVKNPCPKEDVNEFHNKYHCSAWNTARKGTHAKAGLIANVLKEHHK